VGNAFLAHSLRRVGSLRTNTIRTFARRRGLTPDDACDLVQGFLADHLGLRTVTAGSAILMLAVLAAVRTLRPGYTMAIETPFVPVAAA
jgi:hypothetical protein